MRSASLVARLVPDEAPGLEVSQRLLDLRARVHHERSVPGDRLAKRARRREEKPAAAGSGRGLHDDAVGKDDKGRRAGGWLFRPEDDLAHVQYGERLVAP